MTRYAHRLEAIAEELRAEGVRLSPWPVRHRQLPIPDMGVPTAAHMTLVLDTIRDVLAEGRTPYVHCWGGVGRTGTVVGCHLVRCGVSGDAALSEVARLFGTMSAEKLARFPEGSPQTSRQKEFVKGWVEAQGVRRP